MDGRGKDLLDLFIRAGCSEAKADDVKGEDLGKHSSLDKHDVFFPLVLECSDKIIKISEIFCKIYP